MPTHPTSMTVVDYCAALDRGEIIVNRSYQRSDKVWPDSARSFLIESILLDFPMPKLYIHFSYDLKQRKMIKEIVDGQQRTSAIKEFFENKFRLDKNLETEEVRGMLFSELPEDWASKFVSYIISIDQFLGVSPEYVRQIFRRMNSYTVPLNPEELRHAERQGKFKWFIARLADRYSDRFAGLGVFTSKSIVRMQDLKLYSEVAHAMTVGVKTTAKKDLDWIYKHFDSKFEKEAEFHSGFEYAFDILSSMDFLKNSVIAKSYQIYSLSLALINAKVPIEGVEKLSDMPIRLDVLEKQLLNLSDVIEQGPNGLSAEEFGDFIAASSEKTNVKAERIVRINTFVRAIEQAQTA